MLHIDLIKNRMIPYCISTNPPTTLLKWSGSYQHPTSNDQVVTNIEEIFNASKYKYEATLKSGYQQTKLKFNKKGKKRKRSQNIIWFNPSCRKNVTTNVAKRFPNLLDIHFPKSNNFHKILNRNTVKLVSVAPRIYQVSLKLTIKK